MIDFEKARALLHEFKGSSYLFGSNVLPQVGEQAAVAGKKAALILKHGHILIFNI